MSVAYILYLVLFSVCISEDVTTRVHIMILGFVKFYQWLFPENSILQKLRFIDIHWLNDIFSSKRYNAASLVS